MKYNPVQSTFRNLSLGAASLGDRGLFVDLMYAVTVGAALPRLDDKILHIQDPTLWGLLFLIAVFLEDFFLYHVKVVPNLQGPTNWRGFVLAMLIIMSWYMSQAAFPSNPRLFLISFAVFFSLKMLGGVLMRTSKYPADIDTLFLIPITVALILVFRSESCTFVEHPVRFLYVLAPAWFVSIVLWWGVDSNRKRASPFTEPPLGPFAKCM